MKLGMMNFAPSECAALGASQSISSLASGSSLDDADVLPYTETSSLTTKKITWANATSTLKTFYDTVYSPLFSTSAGLASLLSDETGTAGGFVRATSSVLETPRINGVTFDVAGTDATGDIYYNGGSGAFTRLAIGASTGHYLRTSAGGIPEWDNSVATFPYNASSTFMATTTWQAPAKTLGVNIFGQFVASTTITGQSTPQPVFLATTTNSLHLSEADGNASSTFLGFAVSGALNGATTTVQLEGIVPGFSGLTKGQRYYVSDTAGSISLTQGTNEVIAGTAISSTEIMVTKNPDGVWQYVGSGTCNTSTSCTIAVPNLARFAIVKSVLSSSNGCGGGTGGQAYFVTTIAKTGIGDATVQVNSGQGCGDAVASNGAANSQITWGTSGITIANTIGGTDNSNDQTVYFYR